MAIMPVLRMCSTTARLCLVGVSFVGGYYLLTACSFGWIVKTDFSDFLWTGNNKTRIIHDYVLQRANSTVVTIITSVFVYDKHEGCDNNINNFDGCDHHNFSSLINKWRFTMKKSNNPIIVFTNHRQFYDKFIQLRKYYEHDKLQRDITLVDRRWLHSMTNDQDAVAPKISHSHIKYLVLGEVINRRLYKTKYLLWISNNVLHKIDMWYPISPPLLWNENKIASVQVQKYNDALNSEDFQNQLHIWVSCNVFLGRPETMYLHATDYLRALSILHDQDMALSDWQVVYALHLPSFNLKPSVEIQPFTRLI